LIGEAPALKSKENMLDHELATFTVECLPAKIPDNIEVDVSSLTELDQAIRVKDITLDKDVSVLNSPDLVVAKVSFRHVEKVEEEVAEEVVAAEAEAAEEEAEATEEAESEERKPEET
jgi:large subunit ribosomal protein L25